MLPSQMDKLESYVVRLKAIRDNLGAHEERSPFIRTTEQAVENVALELEELLQYIEVADRKVYDHGKENSC